MTNIQPQTRAEAITPFVSRAHNWSVPEIGAPLERGEILNRFDTIAQTNVDFGGQSTTELLIAHQRSVDFVNNAFDVYEGKKEAEPVDWTFAVPVRGEEFQGDEYATEVTYFLPILEPQFGVNSLVRQRTVAHLAPTVLDTYKGDEQGTNGALIWSPVYFDPAMRNGDRAAAMRALEGAKYRIGDTAHFIRDRLGASVMGLGAVLPGLTNFGRAIKEEGLVTTTGHGGTVHLIAETARDMSEKMDKVSNVGILGLGKIGKSSLDVLNSDYYDLPKDFVVYDKDSESVASVVRTNPDANITPVYSEREVLEQSDIIVVAITKRIDLDEVELQSGSPIDLTGKVIIDDSQPGSFFRYQVEARGGKLVWVVGEDTAPGSPFLRLGGYQYGTYGGLHGVHAVWGCEAEAGSIALATRRGMKPEELAINTPVNAEMAHRIGQLCFETGVRVSSPPQSYGRPVEF